MKDCNNQEEMQNEVLDIYKGVGSSKIVLAIIILLIVLAAFMVHTILNIDNYLANNQIYEAMTDKWAYKFGTILGSSLQLLVVLLMFMGFLRIYSCSLKDGDTMNTSGLSILKGTCIFLLVSVCLGVLLGFVYLSNIILFLIIEVMFVIAIVYYVKLIKMLESIKVSISIKSAALDIPLFVIVMNYISAGMGILGMLFRVVLVDTLIIAVVSILVSILLMSLKKSIEGIQFRKSYKTFQNIEPTYVVMEDKEEPIYKMALPKLEKEKDKDINQGS